jgi:hypothetical protein
MNRVTRGSVVLAGVLSAISCSGDPTSSLRNGIDHLNATPSALYVASNTTKLVTVEAVDAQGNIIAASFSVGAVGAGITVVNDSTFDPVFNNSGKLVQPSVRTSARFIVTPTQYAASQFTINAGGKSITIPVRVAPASINTPLSKTNAAFGDTITVTAPTGLEFDTLNSLVLLGADTTTITAITPTSISFVPGLNAASGKPTVTKVTALYAPTAGTFTVPTDQTLALPARPTLGINKTNANIGDTIVVTAPGALRFTPTSAPSVGTTGVFPLGVSADSLSVKFLVGPNAKTVAQVTNIVISGIPGKKYSDTTAAVLNSTVVNNLPATVSSLTPNPSDTVTLTSDGTWKFLSGATVTISGLNAIIVSVSADSNTIKFIPFPGVNADSIRLTHVAFASALKIPLSIPAAAKLTPPAGYAGTGAFATAPTITIPATGLTSLVLDAGPESNNATCLNDLGGPCRIYKFVLATARTFNFKATWQGTTDIGVYFYDATPAILGTNPGAACDAKGEGAAGQPEQCTVTLAAGTYYFVPDDFGPFYPDKPAAPKWFRFDITGQ